MLTFQYVTDSKLLDHLPTCSSAYCGYGHNDMLLLDIWLAAQVLGTPLYWCDLGYAQAAVSSWWSVNGRPCANSKCCHSTCIIILKYAAQKGASSSGLFGACTHVSMYPRQYVPTLTRTINIVAQKWQLEEHCYMCYTTQLQSLPELQVILQQQRQS